MKWLIFDLGGVIADESAFDRLNLKSAVDFCVGRGFRVDLDLAERLTKSCPRGRAVDRTTFALTTLGVPDAVAQDAANDLYERCPTTYYESLSPMREVVRALGELRRHARLCIAANQHPEVYAWLRLYGLETEVSATRFSFEMGSAKPSVGFFTEIAGFLSAEPSECIYVGDRVDNDVIPALEAGMVPVRFIGDGEYACQCLESFGITGVVEIPDASLVLPILADLCRSNARRVAAIQ